MTRRMTGQRRFVLLQRADFTCAFCGSRPGNDRLHIAHIYPHSLGGTEHDDNLTVACDRCNLGMGTLVAIPKSLLNGERDPDGWLVWKRWGPWVLSFCPEAINPDPDDFMVDPSTCQLSLVYSPTTKRARGFGYDIRLERVHEHDWEAHLCRKGWLTREEIVDFAMALEFARNLVEAP